MQILNQLKILTLTAVIAALMSTVGVVNSQTNSDYTVEVLVADPGESQRSSAYWLALDRALRRNLPPGSVDEVTREELLKNASRYVQAYRYREYNPAADSGRLSTRKVREGAPVDSVIAVTLPASLPAIIQQQTQAIEVVEEVAVQGSGNILALIAVEQDGQQFLIGGERGRKFQSRLRQLGVANNLSFEFPLLDASDTEIINASSVLYNETDQLYLMVEKYNSSGVLNGALVRLSADSWQSNWTLEQGGQPPRTVNLTTRSLDEALISAITEVAGGASNTLGSNYLSGAGFQRSGVALRVENITSLAQYEQALALLKTIDSAVVTEALLPDATVFRAAGHNAESLRQVLARQPQFSPVLMDETSAVSSAELSYRFESR